MNRVLPFFIICCAFLFSCGENVAVTIEPKLTSFEIKREGIISQYIQNEVEYEGSKIVKIGNSNYYYNPEGRVIKEIQRISQQSDPNYISGTPEFDLVYTYIYDHKNRLTEIKLSTDLSTHFIVPSSNYRFNIKYVYQGDMISKIEYMYTFDLEGKKVVNYFFNGNKLDSVKVEENFKRALQDRWNIGSKTNQKVKTYRIEQTNAPNHLRKIFSSLGFTPAIYSLTDFDIYNLTYAINSYSVIDSSSNQINVYKYFLGSNDLLERVEVQSKQEVVGSLRDFRIIASFKYE